MKFTWHNRREFFKEISGLALVASSPVGAKVLAESRPLPSKWFVSLHEEPPVKYQTQGEISYLEYLRQPMSVVYDGTDWVNATIKFPECGMGEAIVRYFAIGERHQGAGKVLVSGPLNAELFITRGITAVFQQGAMHFAPELQEWIT